MFNTRIVTCAFAVAGALVLSNQAKAQAPAQIFSCVNNAIGAVKIIAQNTTCLPSEHLVTWNVVGPQGPVGSAGPAGPAGPQGPAGTVLAVSEFQLVAGAYSDLQQFIFSSTGNNFGSGISTAGGQFSSIVVQPGIYQIHLSGGPFDTSSADTFSIVTGNLNGNNFTFWVVQEHVASPSIIGGDRLVMVSQPNSLLTFGNFGIGTLTTRNDSPVELIITRLQ
jgi:hypothetical protein